MVQKWASMLCIYRTCYIWRKVNFNFENYKINYHCFFGKSMKSDEYNRENSEKKSSSTSMEEFMIGGKIWWLSKTVTIMMMQKITFSGHVCFTKLISSANVIQQKILKNSCLHKDFILHLRIRIHLENKCCVFVKRFLKPCETFYVKVW